MILKRFVDTVLLFCLCFLTGTGLMMKFSFVKGAGPQTVLSLTKHEWENLHLYVGVAMFTAMIVHLVLNRAWIIKVGAKNRKWLAFFVIALGAAVVLALVLSPVSIVK